jgi:uncharacterized ion transporter superfamily protein YfcC
METLMDVLRTIGCIFVVLSIVCTVFLVWYVKRKIDKSEQLIKDSRKAMERKEAHK